MTAIEEAAFLYKEHDMVLAHDLQNYLKHGYVFVTPEWLLLARPIFKNKGPDVWTDTGDTWYVKLAVGRGALKQFIGRIPYSLPYLAWKRNFKNQKEPLHVWPAERAIKLINKDSR